MKKNFTSRLIYFILAIGSITACSSSDDNVRNNPNLANINFSFAVNLDFPEYNQLNFPGNQYVIRNETIGLQGVVIYNVNNQFYLAYELSDPNHPPSDCSAMTLNGIEATCSCEGNVYNIITGELVEGEGNYAMKAYRVEKRGNTLIVSN